MNCGYHRLGSNLLTAAFMFTPGFPLPAHVPQQTVGGEKRSALDRGRHAEFDVVTSQVGPLVFVGVITAEEVERFRPIFNCLAEGEHDDPRTRAIAGEVPVVASLV